MESKKKVVPVVLSADTNRSLDSFDKANSDIHKHHATLTETYLIRDLAMEEAENNRIWDAPDLSIEEKQRLSQKSHAAHNDERIKYEKESARVAENLTKTTGNVILSIGMGGVIGFAVGLSVWLSGGKKQEEFVEYIVRGMMTGATVGGVAPKVIDTVSNMMYGDEKNNISPSGVVSSEA